MSTILKALRRLEHDKRAEAARERSRESLAPAWAAAEPTSEQAPGRPWASWLAVAAVAATVGAGASYGLASWWISRSAAPASVDVASASPHAPAPIAAVPRRAPAPAEARATAADAPTYEAVPAPTPPSSVEARRQPGVPVPAARAGGGSGSPSPSAGGTPTEARAVLAQVAASSPDPWEEAAQAAPPTKRSAQEVARTERVMPMESSVDASSTASEGASGAASSAASGAAESPSATVEAPIPSRRADAAQAPIPSYRADAAPLAIEGAVAVSSLPELVLPEPTPSVPAEPAVAADSARANPSAAASDSGGRLEIQVLKTVWHPKPERRSARVRLSDRIEVLEVHQDDVVEGYVVSEITPSSVVLARGEEEFTYRVGR